MTKHSWLVRDARTLCLDGYPIQIISHNTTTYEVVVEGQKAWLGITLDTAKRVGERLANDLDVFEPARAPEN